MRRRKHSYHSCDPARIEKITDDAIDETQRVIEAALGERFAAPAFIEDWWKPDPEDPFWMLENDDGGWLKNEHSGLTTRDATKAIRYPSEWHADVARRSLPGSGWLTFRPTEHAWITPPASGMDARQGGDAECSFCGGRGIIDIGSQRATDCPACGAAPSRSDDSPTEGDAQTPQGTQS